VLPSTAGNNEQEAKGRHQEEVVQAKIERQESGNGFNDVKSIASELRNNLKAMKVPYDQIASILSNKPVTLTSLKTALVSKCDIEETDAMMAARYIFWENDTKVMFDDGRKLNPDIIAARLQKFVCLNNTLDPYEIEYEESDEAVEEHVGHKNIEAGKNTVFKAIEHKDNEEEEVEDIQDNYSDTVNDFEEENGANAAQKNRPDSPIIQDETDRKNARNNEESDQDQEENESELDDEETLILQRNTFSKIADAMRDRNTTVIQHFRDYILTQKTEAEDGKEYEIVCIPPMGFFEGIQTLGLDLSDTEIKCLMIILMKPEFDNIILVQDLCMIMENFGIKEDFDCIIDDDEDTGRNELQSQPKELSGTVDVIEK